MRGGSRFSSDFAKRQKQRGWTGTAAPCRSTSIDMLLPTTTLMLFWVDGTGYWLILGGEPLLNNRALVELIWGIRTAGTKFAVRETTSIASQILSMKAPLPWAVRGLSHSDDGGIGRQRPSVEHIGGLYGEYRSGPRAASTGGRRPSQASPLPQSPCQASEAQQQVLHQCLLHVHAVLRLVPPTDCGPSMTSAVTSSPVVAGRCMNNASGLAAYHLASTHQSARPACAPRSPAS